MPDHALDLDAYFARIGYAGPRAATADVLREVHRRHAQTITFENLDVIRGRGIRIDLASIEQKLVHEKRGGYCFEQNNLLGAVLRALGFRVTPLMARVRWQVPAEVATPLTHLINRVDAEGRSFLADVGFGSMSLLTPLALEFDREQPSAIEPRRLLQRDGLVVHQARLGQTWGDVYQFALTEAPAIDCEVGNWFTCSHPQSRFVQNLIVARPAGDRRHALLNRELTTRFADGRAEVRAVANADELLTVLAEFFDLHFPPGTRFGPPGSPWPS